MSSRRQAGSVNSKANKHDRITKTHNRAKKAVGTLRAVELRIAGKNYRDIGKELGVDYTTAYRYVCAAIDDAIARTPERGDRLLQMNLDRLNEMRVAYWDAALAGDEKAGTMVLKIMDREARYLGLDAPTKVAETDTQGNDLDLATLAARARENRTRREAEKAVLAETPDA